MSAPMLLDSLAHGDAPPLGRWGTDARIDALPYGDALPSDWRTTAEQLIKEEVRHDQSGFMWLNFECLRRIHMYELQILLALYWNDI